MVLSTSAMVARLPRLRVSKSIKQCNHGNGWPNAVGRRAALDDSRAGYDALVELVSSMKNSLPGRHTYFEIQVLATPLILIL